MKDTTEHQEQLIGLLLYTDTSDAAWMIMQEHKVDTDCFTNPAFQSIYAAAGRIKAKRHALNIVTIGDEVDGQVKNQLNAILKNCLCVISYIEHHIKIVKEDSLSRMAVSLFSSAAVELRQDDADIRTIINDTQSRLVELQANQTSRGNVVHHVTHYREEKVDQWRNAKTTGFIGIPSSMEAIDKALGGYRRKVMCILGGYRGEGKSLFMRQELYAQSRRGYKALLITLEDPEDMAAAVIAGHASRRSIFALDTGYYHDERIIGEVYDAWMGMQELPLWTAAARTIEDVMTIATSHKARHGLDVIGIDHIQYITPYVRPRLDRNGTIAVYSSSICNMLKDLDCAGIVASQFARNAEKENRKPRLSDLRDSGTIEQDCRQALLLYRDGQDHIIEVAKNNFGPSGVEIGLTRVGNEHRFEYRERKEQV